MITHLLSPQIPWKLKAQANTVEEDCSLSCTAYYLALSQTTYGIIFWYTSVPLHSLLKLGRLGFSVTLPAVANDSNCSQSLCSGDYFLKQIENTPSPVFRKVFFVSNLFHRQSFLFSKKNPVFGKAQLCLSWNGKQETNQHINFGNTGEVCSCNCLRRLFYSISVYVHMYIVVAEITDSGHPQQLACTSLT